MLKKLGNGELVQVQLSHDEEGRRKALLYGVGWVIPACSTFEQEAYEEGLLLANEVEVITSSSE